MFIARLPIIAPNGNKCSSNDEGVNKMLQSHETDIIQS
jgi:hypothetical protein